MTKDDFANQGFSILLPDDPHYEGELQKLELPQNPNPRQPPFSVLVKNTSQRAVVAFGIRFTKRLANGSIATCDFGASQPYALVDLGQPDRYDKQPEGLVQPGTAQLVTEDGIVDPSSKGYTSYRTAMPSTIISVQLDSVVFDDGEAIGPDQLNVMKRLWAHINAQQDLMEEISDRLATGERLRYVLRNLQRTSSSADFSEMEIQTAMATADIDKVYPLVRVHYLAELSTTEANAGDEIAARRLQQLKYAARPNLHLPLGGEILI
jgi:hypothetical protein